MKATELEISSSNTLHMLSLLWVAAWKAARSQALRKTPDKALAERSNNAASQDPVRSSLPQISEGQDHSQGKFRTKASLAASKAGASQVKGGSAEQKANVVKSKAAAAPKARAAQRAESASHQSADSALHQEADLASHRRAESASHQQSQSKADHQPQSSGKHAASVSAPTHNGDNASHVAASSTSSQPDDQQLDSLQAKPKADKVKKRKKVAQRDPHAGVLDQQPKGIPPLLARSKSQTAKGAQSATDSEGARLPVRSSEQDSNAADSPDKVRWCPLHSQPHSRLYFSHFTDLMCMRTFPAKLHIHMHDCKRLCVRVCMMVCCPARFHALHSAVGLLVCVCQLVCWSTSWLFIAYLSGQCAAGQLCKCPRASESRSR